MPTSEKFMLESECVACGCEKVEHFVTQDELMERGISKAQISEAANKTFGIAL